MFYEEKQAIELCEDDPSLTFNLIDEGHLDLFEKLMDRNNIDLNITNENGDNIIMYLFKKGKYDLVTKLMRKRSWNINHQNNEGNTLAHLVVIKNYLDVKDIISALIVNKKFIPNIRNNKGETILDTSMAYDNIYTTMKILEDKRFNNIDLVSFKHLYDNYIKSNEYGTYSKMTNLEVIVDSLKGRELLPKVKNVIEEIIRNFEEIKKLIKENNIKAVDNMIYDSLLIN